MTSTEFKYSKANHFVFIRYLDFGIVILTIYINDILLTKAYVQSQLAPKDLGKVQIFS